MAYIQTRQVTLGELLNGTFRNLSAIKRELAIYFAVVFAIGILQGFADVIDAIIGIAGFIGYFVGQYWLYQKMLVQTGSGTDDRFKVFSFFAIAALLIIPISIGLNFFVIPGLILCAKWVMAPSFLVSEPRNVFESIGDSWRASANNTLPLVLAVLILVFIWIAAIALLGALSALVSGILPLGGSQAGFGWINFNIFPVLMLGLSITAYRSLADDDTSLAAVFE